MGTLLASVTRKQITEEAEAWARTATIPDADLATKTQMVEAYRNGVSQGMAQIIASLKLHGHLEVRRP